MNQRYKQQNRGDRGAYEKYLKGMDASMQQKVALTAAHLLCQGHVLDMGMGSGTGSHALASLYPSLRVTGVDIDPRMVELAREKYQLPNLDFITGDIAKEIVERNSIDAIFNSSVLHHVTSFNGYDHQAAARALRNQVLQLDQNGIVMVRDFVAPAVRKKPILLDLPSDDGTSEGEISDLSSAALFRRFAMEFKNLSHKKGFEFSEIGTSEKFQQGTIFQVSHGHAVEFVLRKDYRKSWKNEEKGTKIPPK